VSDFAARLVRWHKRHGRHDLPWQNTSDPYRVWLSEIMLQQTQVATVIPYYARFLARFGTLAELAAAPVAEVMALWSGLGYYARARNLHACAQAVMREHGGRFPRGPEAIAQLPGIGRSTANSIATICFGAQAPILDGNVKRVLCRAFGIEGFPGAGAVEKRLWALAAELMPARHGATYNQAQMDLGATVCTRSKPRCEKCPWPTSASPVTRSALPTCPNRSRAARFRNERPRCWCCRTATASCSKPGRRPASGAACCRCRNCRQAPTHGNGWRSASPAASSPSRRRRLLLTTPSAISRLRITPLLLRVTPGHAAMEPGLRWLDLAATAGAALPTPVRRILGQIQASGSKPLPSRKR
jgi:A/G-specific adenine glycosylase